MLSTLLEQVSGQSEVFRLPTEPYYMGLLTEFTLPVKYYFSEATYRLDRHIDSFSYSVNDCESSSIDTGKFYEIKIFRPPPSQFSQTSDFKEFFLNSSIDVFVDQQIVLLPGKSVELQLNISQITQHQISQEGGKNAECPVMEVLFIGGTTFIFY